RGFGVGLTLALFSLGACIVEERVFDPQLATCTEYCDVVERKCPDPYKVYDRHDACMAVCQQMDPGDYLGGSDNKNTLACRLQKVETLEFDPETECPQVGPGGGGVCGNDCEAFCKLRQQICTDVPNQTYEEDLSSTDTCLHNCNALPNLASFNA